MIYVDTEFRIPISIPKNIGKYNFLEIIGKGATSVVFKVEKINSDQLFACKVIPRELLIHKDSLMHFEQELRIHSSLEHPNILKIFEIIYKEDYIFVILEYCSNGDLFQWISKTSFTLNIKIISQLVSALKYLHSRGYAHQDIKPENILIDSDWNIKLGDFGNCGSPIQIPNLTFFGTIHYAPPEVFTTKSINIYSVDIWQFGILIYELYTGHLPWVSDSKEIKNEISFGIFEIPIEIPPQIQKIIRFCTNINPFERINVQKIETEIEKICTPLKTKLISTGKNICWSSLYSLNKGKSLINLPSFNQNKPTIPLSRSDYNMENNI